MYSTHTGKYFCICNISNFKNTGKLISMPLICLLIYWNNEATSSTREDYNGIVKPQNRSSFLLLHLHRTQHQTVLSGCILKRRLITAFMCIPGGKQPGKQT